MKHLLSNARLRRLAWRLFIVSLFFFPGDRLIEPAVGQTAPLIGNGACYGNDIPPGVNVNVDGLGVNCYQNRGNFDTAALVTLTAQGAGTVTTQADQVNYNGRGLKCTVNVSAVGGTPSLVVTIQGKDPVSGAVKAILASPSITTTGVTTLTIYPGIAVTANVSASDVLPRTWNISETVSGTTPSVTATTACSVID